MINTATIDTLTALQTDEWMTSSRKPGHDKWMDYGQAIYKFMQQLMELGFEIVLVVGEPGTGKSSGMATLETKTNVWYNADNKNPVWTGGVKEYGKKTNPNQYHIIPRTYDQIITHIKGIKQADGLNPNPIAFVLGHTETYKKGVDTLERLKTLGAVATKMQLEGKMETVLYSKVEIEDGKPTYLLETQNNGYNTARSHQGMFEPKIPNDYQLIYEKLMAF